MNRTGHKVKEADLMYLEISHYICNHSVHTNLTITRHFMHYQYHSKSVSIKSSKKLNQMSAKSLHTGTDVKNSDKE